MRHLVVCACAWLLACARLAQPPPAQTVVLDGWWNADYAAVACEHAEDWSKANKVLINQLGCEAVTACPEMMPVVTDCAVREIREEVRDFENRLATSFATDTTCKGVRIVTLIDPKNNDPAVVDAMRGPYWSLALNFKPGGVKQAWKMNHNPAPYRLTQGEGTSEEIARKVCAIVNERGGTLLN